MVASPSSVPSDGVLLSPRQGTGPHDAGRYWFRDGNLTGNFTLLPAFLSCQFALHAFRSRRGALHVVGIAARSGAAGGRVRAARGGARGRIWLGTAADRRLGRRARAARGQPHAPPEPDRGRALSGGRGHHRATLAAAGDERLHRCGAAAAHARIRARSVRHPARSGPRAGGRRAAAGLGFSSLEPVGHARPLEPQRFSAGHAARALRAAAARVAGAAGLRSRRRADATFT